VPKDNRVLLDPQVRKAHKVLLVHRVLRGKWDNQVQMGNLDLKVLKVLRDQLDHKDFLAMLVPLVRQVPDFNAKLLSVLKHLKVKLHRHYVRKIWLQLVVVSIVQAKTGFVYHSPYLLPI